MLLSLPSSSPAPLLVPLSSPSISMFRDQIQRLRPVAYTVARLAFTTSETLSGSAYRTATSRILK